MRMEFEVALVFMFGFVLPQALEKAQVASAEKSKMDEEVGECEIEDEVA